MIHSARPATVLVAGRPRHGAPPRKGHARVIDESKLPPLEVRPYDIACDGDVVKVRMHKRFDTLEHAWNWARDIVAAITDRPAGIDIDVGGCANVTSMFFAGLLLLRDTYKPMPMRLLEVQDRVYRTLQVMCMDNLFEIHLAGQSPRRFQDYPSAGGR